MRTVNRGQSGDDRHGPVDDIGGEVVALRDAGHWMTEDRPGTYHDRLEAFSRSAD